MKDNLEDEKLLRQYLLGQLSLPQQVDIEARLFLNSDYEQIAQVVRDELVDDYACESLSESERLKFESHFLARPEHRADLKIALALKKLSDRPVTNNSRVAGVPAPSSYPNLYQRWLAFFKNKSILAIPIAASILIVFGLFMWLVIQSVRKDRQPPLEAHDQQPGVLQPTASPQQIQAQDDKKSPQQDTLANKNQSPTPQRSPGGVQPVPRAPEPQTATLAFTIAPGVSVRGETASNRIVLPAQPTRITLSFPLVSDDYKTYRGTLQSQGKTIQRWNNLASEVDEKLGNIVKLEIASSVFREQSYVMKLRGVDANAQAPETEYPFQVQKK
jgi:hypothetical protein